MSECCKDPNNKKDNSGPLSKTILDYYAQYGQNRDLEKYLRYRKCRGGNSSGSGCSDFQVCGADSDKLGRSMETLGELRKTLSGSDTDENKSEKGLKATLNITNPKEHKVSPLKDDKCPTAKPEAVKVKLKNERKSKKKSFNFNMESNIVINVSPKRDADGAEVTTENQSRIKRDFESQTEDVLQKKLEYPETPVKPTAEPQAKLEITIDEPQSISPASSLASVSNKHRLEWDSMADVGYDKSAIEATSNRRSQETHLSSLEKSGLKKFFAQRGISVRDDFVVIVSNSKQTEKSVETDKINVEQQPAAAAAAVESKNQKEAKKKWKIALEKYRSKYLNETLASDFNITESAVHSTPEQLKSKPPQEKRIEDEKADVQAITEKIKNEIEKSCQTSIIGMVSKEIQCNPIIDKDSSQETKMSSSSDQINEIEKMCPASVSSFEYVSPSVYETDMQKEKQEIQIDADSNKENICPSQMEQPQQEQPPIQRESVFNELSSIVALNEIDAQIKEGIEYLAKLLESKTIDRKSKKRMVRKIVLALLQAKTKHRSIFLSNKSEEIERNLEQLLISSESSSSGSSTLAHAKKQVSDDGELSGVKPLSSSSDPEKTPPRKTEPTEPLNALNSTTIDWLQPMTHSEIDYENHQMLNKENEEINAEQKKIEKKLIETQVKCLEKQTKDSADQTNYNRIEWIEKEIARLVALKINLEKEETGAANCKENDGKIETAENVIYQNIKQQEKVISTSSSSSGAPSLHSANIPNRKLPPEPIKPRRKSTSSITPWNSHPKMLQIAKNRTKLKTPDHDIAGYIRSKQQHFVERYESTRGKLYSDNRQLYTQPCSTTDHYSEPRSSNRKSMVTKNDAYTSISGSDVFLSSRSVSIPEAHSTSNTTTHQYDTRASIAVQTSDSVCRTEPIFGEINGGATARCSCSYFCACTCKRRTIRVKQLQNDKKLQVTPESVAYMLTFDNNQSSLNRRKTQEIDHKNRNEIPAAATTTNDEGVTLQDHLMQRRPDFVSKAEDRRKCLNEIHNLRLKQIEQRDKLLLLSSSASLRKHVQNEQKLQQLAQRRNSVFTSKIFRAQTKKQYQKLPEIQRKKEIEKQNKLRKNNRILSEIFKKNLQKRALGGDMNISNSVQLVPI